MRKSKIIIVFLHKKNQKRLRGPYIEDNLYTISEEYIKVNRSDNLKEIQQVKIKEKYQFVQLYFIILVCSQVFQPLAHIKQEAKQLKQV